jgi:hypothetical protein
MDGSIDKAIGFLAEHKKPAETNPEPGGTVPNF